MKAEDFVHLDCHSTYSLLQALPEVEEVVERAEELGCTAVGLTDKQFAYGLIEFHQKCKKHGLKAILGLEIAFSEVPRRDPTAKDSWTPLVLLAENQEGYLNLLHIATKSALDMTGDVPVVDRELLQEYGKGLILLTGPIGSAVAQAALAEDAGRVQSLVELFQNCVGEGNVYIELLDLPRVPGQSAANQQLVSIGKKIGVPLVVGSQAHYCRPDDAEAQDTLLCIRDGARLEDPRRPTMRDGDYSMRPPSELLEAFAHVPEALENTRVIADRCTVELDFGTYHIPRFPVPKGTTETQELQRLAQKGFEERYPNATNEQQERLDYELSVIDRMGFSGYFLIVADFINEAKRRGITVGPGRGSAAGSMVSYCMNITTLDPLAHGLLFERFLNPERISMPDIDVDFADNRRDEVLEYVRQKYGSDHVVQICTFGTLAARAAVKDVGRAYGVPFLEMNNLAKLIPERPGTTLEDALKTQELQAALKENKTYQDIVETAKKLEGKCRHVSVHACGVIITEEPTVHYTALQRAPKDENIIITQSHAKPLDALGLVKMDFLGLTNLTVIQTTLVILQRTRGLTIDIEQIPVDEPAAYKLLQHGDTTGVFQLESGGMRRYLKELKPTIFEDITAMVSLFRPGPMEWIPSYIKRKHGREKITYIHDDLRPVLEPTYGIGIYQEQILEIARTFAGFSLGEADLLRRAIGKKIKSELNAQREKFIACAVAKGYGKKLAEQIFDDVITPFAGYGFNKSHGAGYARIAYETAYLKAKYPVEFMAALLSSDAERSDRVLIEISECRAMGIDVLPPDINESLQDFTALPDLSGKTPGAIRFGLTAIKGIGSSSVQQIIAAREAGGKFANIEDFARRIPAKVLNKKTIEALAKSGALDALGDRRVFAEHYDAIADYAKAAGGVAGQADLFGGSGGADIPSIEFPKTPPADSRLKLQWEKETLGMYVSSHPLAGLKKYIGKKAQLIALLTRDDVGKTVKIAGISEGVKKITTKRGDTMAILFLEDPTAKIEVTLFPKIYAEVAQLLEAPDSLIVAEGTLDVRAGQLQMRANSVKKLSLATVIANAKESGFYDAEEAKSGLHITRTATVDEPETAIAAAPMVDEEGNIIAGLAPLPDIANTSADTSYFGPLGRWMSDGMQLTEALAQIGLSETSDSSSTPEEQEASVGSTGRESHPETPELSLFTITLPERAPKKLLLELRNTLEKFPGSEKVQLKIGEQMVPLPLTVTSSPVLEKHIEDVLSQYRVPVG